MFKWFVFAVFLALAFAEPEPEAKPKASYYEGGLGSHYYGGYPPYGIGHGSWGYPGYASNPYYSGGYWPHYGGYDGYNAYRQW